MIKKFEEYSDCIHCNKHTKNKWIIIGVDKPSLTIVNYKGISTDLSNLYERLDENNRPFRYISIDSNEYDEDGTERDTLGDVFLLQICEACKKLNIRDIESNKLLYPVKSDVAPPNKDMPENIKEIYNEATMIYNNSLRAALALLRLGLELLCDEVGYSSGKLYSRIEKLAEDGVIDDDIKYIAHGVRGLGNDAIHPKQIGDTATKEEVEIVFDLLNMITEELITKPRRKREFAVKYRK